MGCGPQKKLQHPPRAYPNTRYSGSPFSPHGLHPIVLSARHYRLRRPRWATAGACGPWGGLGTGEELLAATLFGTTGSRPNRGCGPRAAARAARHNVTKPHRLRTYQDAGRERASGAASRITRQARARTSRRHWPWTGRSRGPQVDQEEVQSWAKNADVGHGGADRFLSIVTTGQPLNSDHRPTVADHQQVTVSLRSR